jgi:hypothetical protein
LLYKGEKSIEPEKARQSARLLKILRGQKKQGTENSLIYKGHPILGKNPSQKKHARVRGF